MCSYRTMEPMAHIKNIPMGQQYYADASADQNFSGKAFDDNDSVISMAVADENISYYDYPFDYSDMDYIGEVKHTPLWEMAVKITVCVIIMVTAIIGNVLIIIVVSRNKRMRTTTNYYIVNLAVSDLFVTLFCTWVQVVNNITEGYVLGTFFCKVNSFAQVVSLVASIFSLTLIACDRFFGIVFAMRAHIIERKARHSIVILWILAVAAGIPMLVVRKIESVTWRNHVEIWCDDDWPMYMPGGGVMYSTGRKVYYTTLTVVLYFLPMVIMTGIYSVIIFTVWFARVPGETVTKETTVQSRKKRKVVIMLVLILAVFGLCWLPLQIILLYSEYRPSKTTPLDDWYYIMEFVAYFVAFSNSAVNPLIYAGFNENFRRGFRALFGYYNRKLYAAMTHAESMYNSTTAMSKV